MDEELIEYLFQTSKKEGFKKNREDFVKYLQSDDELFDYLYGKAQKEGYKKGKDHFAGLVGRTTTAAPVATTEPAKTEVATTTTTEPTKTEPITTAATTTPAKTEPAKPTVTVATETAPAKTEPAKELSNKQSETIKVRSIPQREVEMPVADTNKMPPMTVKEAAPVDEEEPKKEMPIGENLLPVTEKTEIKAVETPSDKMVIKSEKAEEPKGIPSYDDLGIEKGTNLLTNTPYVLPKGIKYKEMSPSEIISTVVDENGFVSRNGIKLNRNTSLRYPDPPGTVFKKEKVGEREVYSSYDKANDKWYIYDENSNKDNWTEVKAGPIKTLLNSKFSDKEDKEKIDKVTEDERNLIDKTRNSVYVNVYMPYLLKNEDKLSDEESLKLQKMIKGIAHFKTLEAHFKEEPFTGSLEEYLEKKNKHISDTREMPEIKDITDKKHLQIINDIIARTDNENGYFKQFFESKNYPTENFSYSELENRKSNNELDSYKSILGTVFYDKNKDEFYWTEYDKKRIAREKYNHVYEGDKLEFDEKSQLPYLVIKKGTPDYDKIKSSLSKYNK